jgi:hypothetical protein
LRSEVQTSIVGRVLFPLLAAIASASGAPATTAFLGATPGSDVAPQVAAAFVGNPSVTMQAPAVTATFMETAKGLGASCDPALDECLLQLAAICTVQQAVYATVDGQRLTLRLGIVDGGAVRSLTIALPADDAVRTVALREAIAELVSSDAVASLVVEAEPGSVIALDGLVRGTAPLSSELFGIAPGQHFVDVRFPDGSTVVKTVTLGANTRTRIVAVKRPIGADVMVWTGWGALGFSALATTIATYAAGVYMVSRARLEDFSTHYALERDYNDTSIRTQAIQDQDYLTDLPTYGYPLFTAAGVSAGAGVALLFLGQRWSDLFDPPSEETAR